MIQIISLWRRVKERNHSINFDLGYDVTTLARMGTEQVQCRKIFLQRSDPQSSEEMANTWKLDNRCST
ncbi:unnamed protein product [Caretta caretta]